MKKMVLKTYMVAILCLLFLVASGGFVFAYLSYFTLNVDNSFKVDVVPGIVVHETLSEDVKSNVYIGNDSEYAVYIRAAILVNWENGTEVYGIPPVEGTDYTIEINTMDWIKMSDGFYYYKYAVNAKTDTKNLINECRKLLEPVHGYSTLGVDIVVQSIQALGNAGEGKLAVEEAWGVKVTDGVIESK